MKVCQHTASFLSRYPICPVPLPRMTRRDKWAQRPRVLKYRAYKQELKIHGVTHPVPCKIIFHIPMPKSWSKKKKLEMDGKPHRSVPDVDNLLKGFLDGLYEEDSHIWSIWPEKRWAKEGAIEVCSV